MTLGASHSIPKADYGWRAEDTPGSYSIDAPASKR
jgi:hypothetical protein